MLRATPSGLAIVTSRPPIFTVRCDSRASVTAAPPRYRTSDDVGAAAWFSTRLREALE
jgi:hypothetical protein